MPKPAQHLTPDELVAELGELMFGRSWRRRMADSLALSHAQVARWAMGAPVTPQMRSVLAMWARDEIARETARALRRIELLSVMAALQPTKPPASKE